MTKPFPPAFKRKMVARLAGQDAVSARDWHWKLAPATNVLAVVAEASNLRVMPAKRSKSDWSIKEKNQILAEGEPAHRCRRSEFLRRAPVLQAESEQWGLTLDEEGRASLRQ